MQLSYKLTRCPLPLQFLSASNATGDSMSAHEQEAASLVEFEQLLRFLFQDPSKAKAAMAEVEELDLRPESKRKFLRDNAIQLFKLPTRTTEKVS